MDSAPDGQDGDDCTGKDCDDFADQNDGGWLDVDNELLGPRAITIDYSLSEYER